MSVIRNVVHGQEYGNEGKKKWTNCGILIEKDGRFFVKLTHMPLARGGDDDGIFFSVFDQDHNKDKEPAQRPMDDDDDLDDDIPF